MKDILVVLTSIFTLVAGILAAFWAYTKFVLERGLLPPVQFYIECSPHGVSQGKRIIEFLIHVKNIGSATLVARNIRLDIRYRLRTSGTPELFRDFKKLGRLNFPQSLAHDLDVRQQELPPQAHSSKESPSQPLRQRGLPVMAYDTFVQAGVDQSYAFVTALPEEVESVLAWASFEYGQRPAPFQDRLLKLSRRLGLIQYSLQHVQEPHTVERVFWVAMSS